MINYKNLIISLSYLLLLFSIFDGLAILNGFLAFLIINMIFGNTIINYDKLKNVEDSEEAHQEKTEQIIKFAFNNTRNKQKKNKKYMVKPKREGKY